MEHRKARRAGPAAHAALLLGALTLALMLGFVPGAGAADPGTTFTSVQTLPVPPASNYAGSGGGDGWAVALSPNAVFNVFHHQTQLQVACHFQIKQSDTVPAGAPCWASNSGAFIRDDAGGSFSVGGQPGLYLDQKTGKLYVYATHNADSTTGVVCIDTTPQAGPTFCGFTPLTSVGGGSWNGNGSTVSDGIVIGSRYYAVNFVSGALTSGGQGDDANTILCFDLTTFTKCSGQPYSLGISGTVSAGNYPPPEVAAIGTDFVIPVNYRANGQEAYANVIACFDTTTTSACTGSWPVAASGYAGNAGPPFPLLDASGTLKGLCIPYSGDPCWSLAGASVATPAGLATAIGTTGQWNGPAVVIGPRIYVPSNSGGDHVRCFDYNTGNCGDVFAKSFSGLGFLYTVNVDPQRPTCLWVNADGGGQQIQNFDAFTAGPCGQGPIRVLASSFVVQAPQCTPGSYTSIQVTSPTPDAYAHGSIQFTDPSNQPLPGVAPIALDSTGTASLAGLTLNTAAGLPQFLITLSNSDNQAIPAQSVTVKLTWTGTFDPTCASGGRVDTPPAKSPPPPPPPPPTPNIGVTASGPPVARVGNNVTFTATVTNTSSKDVETGAELKAPIPAGSTLVSAKGSQGVCPTGAQIDCALGTIAPGASATVTVVVTANQAGTLTFSPTIAGDYDTSAADNSASASTPVEAAGAIPPAPPAPTTPGTVNAISVGTIVVNGVTIPPDTIFTIKAGDSVQLNGALVFTTIAGSVGTFSNVPFTGARTLSGLRAWLHAAETGPTSSFTVTAPTATTDTTDLTLTGGDFSSCSASRRLSANPKPSTPVVVRQLWGHAHGAFRTTGHYSSATIRGTIWGVQDRCDGTLTTAVDDVVTVVDTVLGKTVSLNPGQTYLAKPKAFTPPTQKQGPTTPKTSSKGNSVDSVLASGIVWAGHRFKSQQAFSVWLSTHKSSWTAWAKAHPVLAAALATR